MRTTFFSGKGWKSYLLQALLFIGLVIVADFCVGKLLKYLYKKQPSGWEYSTRYSAEDTKADVLIFGASRAQQQYNPQYFEDSLGLTCYNVGRDGTPFFYHYAMLQMILKRHTPKIIVLDCEYGALKYAASSYERLSPLLPLYQDHPEMRSIINLRSPYEKYKFASQIYPYNSMLFKLLLANLKPKKAEDIKGYLPLERSLKAPVKTYDLTKTYELDSNKVQMLEAFIDDCKKNNIALYIVCGPYYMKTNGVDYTVSVTKKIAAEKNIRFLDYSKDSMYYNSPQLFDDTVHVNIKGSAVISSAIAGEIKKTYQP